MASLTAMRKLTALLAASAVVKKSRILVVEDHTPTRQAMSRLLRQAGAEVVTARDGEEGLGYLLTQHFDVLMTGPVTKVGEGMMAAEMFL